MKLINADYLTGRIFTEADLTNAHTCYDSIMAIIESMESEDVLEKIRTEIEQLRNDFMKQGGIYEHSAYGLDDALVIIGKIRNEVNREADN